nr:transposase [Enterocloster clostridioformis]
MTFHYQRHEDHKTITECIPGIDFIKLIVDIPDRHFKMVRYYGIYAKHHKQEKNLRKCLSPQKRQYLSRLLDWRNSILLAFGYDPLRCPECGTSDTLSLNGARTAVSCYQPSGLYCHRQGKHELRFHILN